MVQFCSSLWFSFPSIFTDVVWHSPSSRKRRAPDRFVFLFCWRRSRSWRITVLVGVIIRARADNCRIKSNVHCACCITWCWHFQDIRGLWRCGRLLEAVSLNVFSAVGSGNCWTGSLTLIGIKSGAQSFNFDDVIGLVYHQRIVE